MEGFKFDPEKLEKLNDPERLKDIPPEHIIEKLKINDPRIVIDIGAGTGLFSRQFADIYSVDKVYALDIADEMIDWMKQNVKNKHPKVHPMKMDEDQINLNSGIADLVVMINVHHEFHEPEKILKEVYRLLGTNGKMAIVDWAKKETEHGPPVEKRYKPEQIVEQVKNAGFINTNIHEEMSNHFLIVAEKE